MSKEQVKTRDREHRRLLAQLAAVTAIYLAFHVLSVFWRQNSMWGADFLAYMSLALQSLFVLFGVVLFFPGFARQIRSVLRNLPFALWTGGKRMWVTRTLMLLLALISFIAFSSARHFLGDGYLLLRELVSDTGPEPFRAPLSFALIRGLHQAGQTLWQTAENTFRIYSYAAGVLYLLIAFPVSATVGKSTLEKSIVLAFLITPGYMQLFFGYVENYAIYMPVLLLYVLLGLRTVENRLSLYVPALLLGLLLTLHRAFAVFCPSIIVLAYRAYRQRSDVVPIWKNLVTTLGALCCVPLTAALLLGMCGVGVEEYLSRTREREFLPLFEEAGIHAQYRMFSLAHIWDYINLQLLSAPVVCVAPVLFRKKDLSQQLFLSVCTAVPLVFTLLANPGIGAFRDWDIFSLSALPLTLWTAVALLTRIREREPQFLGTFLLCGAAALHTYSWVALNANAGTAEARFVHLADGLRGEGGVNAWVAVGNIQRQEGRYAEALYAYKRARDLDPANPNRWLLVGVVYRDMRRSASAIECFKKVAELRPDQPVPYMNLGATYSDLGQFDKAIEYTRKAIAIDPNMAAAHMNLGAIYGKTGQYETGIQHLSRALELQPDNPETYKNLGLTYKAQGKHTRALENFKKALELQSGRGDLQAHLNIGDTYHKMAQHEKAIPYYQKAIQLNPNHANAHLLLGLSYHALNRREEARLQFEKTLQLEPNHPQAARIRQWLERIRR